MHLMLITLNVAADRLQVNENFKKLPLLRLLLTQLINLLHTFVDDVADILSVDGLKRLMGG